jgi:ABC-type nitrate/sulfonate/bicarbonate transport system substrate-binding protein
VAGDLLWPRRRGEEKNRMTQSMLRVAAGHYHLFHRVAPTVAEAKGYFADEGLEVHISATGTDQNSLQALLAGEIDIIIDLKTPVAFRGAAQGAPLVLLGGFLNSYPGILVGAKGISSVADLRRKTVGTREPNGVQLTLTSMVLMKAGLDPATDVTLVPHTGASSFKSIAPKLDRGEIHARIAHKAFLAEFKHAGYPILADLADYLPDGYQLRAIAAMRPFVANNPDAVLGFLKGTIRAYRFMKASSNHPEMMRIIENSDLRFEEDMDQSMWEEEYPLIPAIPNDGSINAKGLQIILDEEKAAGRVPRDMTIERILQLDLVKSAAAAL